MNRDDFRNEYMKQYPWCGTEVDKMAAALEIVGVLRDESSAAPMKACPDCGNPTPWPDGFANGKADGTRYVCRACAAGKQTTLDAWIDMWPSRTPFSLADPQPDDVHIEDIAWHLSGIFRYTGGSAVSVAEHSIQCAERAPPELKLEALLHDAHEAYTGDCSRPLKHLLGQAWRTVEERIDRAVRWRFKLPWPASPEIKAIDDRLLATEAVQIWHNPKRDWRLAAAPYPDLQINPLSSEEAEAAFLAAFADLGGR